MTRHDLYRLVHKGLRARLAAAATLTSGTDFRSADEARACAAALRRLLGFFDEHAHHEDALIVPELARLNPELGAALAADHARLDELQREVELLANRVERADAGEREWAGARLHELVWKLVAEHANHMAVEESAGNRTLWAHHTDEELAAIKGKIIAAIAPERLAEWFELMLPAIHGGERAALLRELNAVMPPHVFAALMTPARATLGESAWHASEVAAGIAITTRELQLAS